MATIIRLKSGRWRVQVRRKQSYVSQTFLRHEDARMWAIAAERRIDLGEAPLKRGKADPKTLAHLVDLHADDMREVGKAPQRSKQFTLNALKAKLGKVRHKDLTREHLIQFGKVRWWVEKPEGLVLVWSDGPDAPLETQLPEIAVHLIAAAEMRVRIHERQQYQWRVDRKERIIEAERQLRLEAERQERARLRRLEKARTDKLLGEAMSLRLADDIRAYVAAVTARNADDAEPVPDADMATWTQWALAQADRIDPVRSRAFLQPVPEEENAGEDEPASSRAGQGRAGATAHRPTAAAWHPNRWYTRLHR